MVLGLVLVASLAAAPAAAAAEPTFGTATATQAFLLSISVEQPASLPRGVHRVEAFVRVEGSDVTFLADVPNPGEGSHVLRYTYPTPSGAIYPNTRIELGFRVTLDDGTIADSSPARIRYQDTRFSWNTLEGDIVRVHWYSGSDAFGRRALQIGEQSIKDASDLLGVTETKPIDYFVYADRDAFYDVLGPASRENVGGVALPEIRTLFANIAPSELNDAWVGIVVPHELTHLVFGTATQNPYHEPPHWINEGLAVYLSQGYAADARADVARAARGGAIMPLRALVGQFPTTAERFSLAYDESVAAIDFLVRTYGKEALVKLIRSYAEGVSEATAFDAALSIDDAAFEKAWLADLGIDEPIPEGPLPAPPGELPPDWAPAPAVTANPGASGLPAPTIRTSPAAGEDLSGPIAIGVLLVVGLLLVGGLAVVARGLSSGRPLLAPLASDAHADGGEAPPELDDAPAELDEAASAQAPPGDAERP
jgi:hypothetical protein